MKSVAAIALLALALLTGRSDGPVLVRQIDHILFVTSAEGAGLVSILRDKFELPVVFDGPSQTPPSPGTCFGFGNVCLEIIPLPRDPGEAPMQPRITSLAAEATDFAGTPQELKSRGIDHHPVSTGKRWTTLGLRGLGHGFFFIEYQHEMPARRAAFARMLAERGGGPLGIASIREIAIAPASLDETHVRWAKLLGAPVSSGGRLWSVGDGPAVRLVGESDPLRHRIVVTVHDLGRAAAALTRLGIPHDATGAGLAIDPKAMFGLRLVLST